MNNLRIAHTNGKEIEAPLAVWFVAMFRGLSDEQQSEVFKQADEIMGKMVAALLSGKPMSELAVNMTTEEPPISASLNGKPPKVITDKKGKKHHTIYCEPGSYVGELKGLTTQVNGKEQQ